jgi:hypothetical protein
MMGYELGIVLGEAASGASGAPQLLLHGNQKFRWHTSFVQLVKKVTLGLHMIPDGILDPLLISLPVLVVLMRVHRQFGENRDSVNMIHPQNRHSLSIKSMHLPDEPSSQ